MYDREFLDLLNEEESSLEIGSARTRRYRKPQERREPNFAEIIHDAKFEILGVGDMPEGEYFWCSFCGNRAKHFVLVRRASDNSTWKVGKFCVDKVGLELTGKESAVIVKRPGQPKVEEEEEEYCSLDEFFED